MTTEQQLIKQYLGVKESVLITLLFSSADHAMNYGEYRILRSCLYVEPVKPKRQKKVWKKVYKSPLLNGYDRLILKKLMSKKYGKHKTMVPQ